MSPLAGIAAIGALLLVVASVAKVLRPGDTARALAGARLPGSPATVRIGAIVEGLIGGAALAVGTTVPVALVAGSYVAFASFVTVALVAKVPIRTCGCFGEPDSAPSVMHVGVNTAIAGCCAYAAATGGRVDLVAAVHQPWDGVPFFAVVAVGTLLAYLAMVELPRTTGARTARAIKAAGGVRR